MSENAGEYTRKITIQRRVPGKGPTGQPLDTWEEVHKLWSKPRTETGMATIRQEGLNHGIMTTPTRYSFRVRYRTDLDVNMRIVHRGRVYDILRIQTDEAGREWTDIVAELGANAG